MNLLTSKALKFAGLAFLASIGFVILVELVEAAYVRPPEKTDFAQDYLMAKAVFAGMNPYLPLNVLGEHFGITTQFFHPSPHPPPFILMSLPLGLLSFKNANFVWLIIGLVSLLISIRLIFKTTRISWLVLFLVAFVWPPIWSNFHLGQLMVFQLLFLTLAWISLSARRDLGAGVLIGLVISIKPILWPLLLLFVIKKRLVPLIAATATFMFANLLAAIIIGFDRTVNYYLKTGREVAEIYNNHAGNFSAWTLGDRLFVGTKRLGVGTLVTQPLFNFPKAAFVTSVICVAIMLILGFWIAIKERAFETSISVLVCTAVLVSPVSWTHYLVLLIPSCSLMLRSSQLSARCATYFVIAAPFVSQLLAPLFKVPIPFALSMLAILPFFALVMMMLAHRHQHLSWLHSTSETDSP